VTHPIRRNENALKKKLIAMKGENTREDGNWYFAEKREKTKRARRGENSLQLSGGEGEP